MACVSAEIITGTNDRRALPPAAAASATLRGLIADAVSDASAAAGDDDAPLRADLIVAPAGIGKTSGVVEALASFPSLRAVALAPDLALAGQIDGRARTAGITSHLILGMGQADETGEKGCAFAEDAAKLAAAGCSIQRLMCDDGKGHACPHLGTCRQSRNLLLAGAPLLCAASDYLHLAHGAIDPENTDLLIADENTVPKLLTWRRTVDARAFARAVRMPGTKGRESGDSATVDHKVAVESVMAALRGGDDDGNAIDDPLAWLRSAVSSDTLRSAALAKFSAAEDVPLVPGMDAAGRSRVIAALSARQAETRGAAHVLMTAAVEMDSGRDGRLYGLAYDAGAETITVHRMAHDRFAGTRRIAIDASMEAGIVRHILNPPAAAFQPKDRPTEAQRAERDAAIRVHVVEAAMSPFVRVRQITDTLMSRSALGGGAGRSARDAARRRDDLKAYVTDVCEEHRAEIEADPRKRVLVCTYKFVEDAWIEEGFHDPTDPGRLFDMLHFGKLRGNDAFRACRAEIVIGRQEAGVDAVEAMARAIWYADSVPLAFVPADESGRKAWPKAAACIRTKAADVAVECPTHPDPRIDALRRTVAAETVQAFARCRPYFRDAKTPCDVHVLTCEPLPGVVADETFEWFGWAKARNGRFAALTASRFVPVKPAAVALAHPGLFATEQAFKQADKRERAKGRNPVPWSFDDPVAALKDGMAPIRYVLPGGGYAGKAWAGVEHCGDAVRLTAFVRSWPGHEAADGIAVLGDLDAMVGALAVAACADEEADDRRRAEDAATVAALFGGTDEIRNPSVSL